MLFNYGAQNIFTDTSTETEILQVDRDFFAPVYMAEYKKTNDKFRIDGLNQVRGYNVAAVEYLHACGVNEFMVFSCYTEGTVGLVQAAWKENGKVMFSSLMSSYTYPRSPNF